jgi:hypothetical protein
MLLVAVMLLVRTYRSIAAADLGYAPERVLAATVRLDPVRYLTGHEQAHFYRNVVQLLHAQSDVEFTAFRGTYDGLLSEIAGASRGPRLSANRGGGVEGDASSSSAGLGIYMSEDRTQSAVRGLYPVPAVHAISDDFFRVLGARLVSGRAFDAGDREGTTPVAVVSERLARHLWKGAAPLGRGLALHKTGAPVIVVGVVADIRQPTFGRRGLAVEALPDIYLSDRQAVLRNAEILVRPRSVERTKERGAIEAAVRSMDSAQVVTRVVRLSDEVGRSTMVLKPLGALMLAFAICALCLAVVGIYGVIACSVVRRTREIGIRLALGASQASIVRLVVRGGVPLLTAGIGTGLLGAILVGAALRHALWGVSPLDPWSHLAVALALVAIGLLACYIPALRGARISAAVALRQD